MHSGGSWKRSEEYVLPHEMNGRQAGILPNPHLHYSQVLAQRLTWQVDPTITVEGVGLARQITTGGTSSLAAARPD